MSRRPRKGTPVRFSPSDRANPPPPDTVAILVTLNGELEATVTSNVMAGYALPAARASPQVHVSVASVQLHPVPLMAVAVRPVGSVSVADTVAVVGEAPVFDTVIV